MLQKPGQAGAPRSGAVSAGLPITALALAALLVAPQSSPGQQDSPTPLRFVPGQRRTEDLSVAYEIRSAPNAPDAVLYSAGVTWGATVAAVEGGTARVQSTVRRMRAVVRDLDLAVSLDSSQDPPLNAHGAYERGIEYPLHMVGRTFEYTVTADGQVTVQGWERALQEAIRLAGCAGLLGGSGYPIIPRAGMSEVMLADALAMAYGAVTGRPVSGAEAWQRGGRFRYGGWPILVRDVLRMESAGGGDSPQGPRLLFEGTAETLLQDHMGYSQGSRRGEATLEPACDNVQSYHEATHFEIDGGQYCGMLISIDFTAE